MIRSIWTLLVLVVTTPLLGLPATVLSLVLPRSHMTWRLGKLWSRAILRAGGVRVAADGLQHAQRPHPCVFMANHQSNADIWVVLLLLPAPTVFVAKQSLFKVPVLGWAMRAAGFISIDRGDRQRAIDSLRRAAARVRGGRPVILFPEGTRSRDGRLQPFKKGAFHLALECAVPVVPLTIRGSFDRLPAGAWVVRPGRIEVRFAPPVDVAPYLPDDVPGLMRAVRGAISRGLEPGQGPATAPGAVCAS